MATENEKGQLEFPYKFHNIDAEINETLKKNFRGICIFNKRVIIVTLIFINYLGVKDGFIQVGPQKWFLPKSYEKHASSIYNFKVRSSDVWLITYPRSGNLCINFQINEKLFLCL